MIIKQNLIRLSVVGLCLSVLFGCESNPTSSDVGSSGGNSKTLSELESIPGTVYHTGFVQNNPTGNSEFTLFVRTGRTIEIEDTTVATVAPALVNVDSEVVDLQLAEMQAAYDEAGETWSARRKAHMKDDHLTAPRFWKIIPLKSGVTAVKAFRSRDRWESIWEKPEIRTLVVTEYTQDQIEQGRQRYTAGGSGMACTNCHSDAFNSTVGAPPHLLGRVIEIDDDAAIDWITTGRAKDRAASINHAWTFNTAANEERATVAYLRTTQTPSEIEFAKLLYQEELIELREHLELPPKASEIDYPPGK